MTIKHLHMIYHQRSTSREVYYCSLAIRDRTVPMTKHSLDHLYIYWLTSSQGCVKYNLIPNNQQQSLFILQEENYHNFDIFKKLI